MVKPTILQSILNNDSARGVPWISEDPREAEFDPVPAYVPWKRSRLSDLDCPYVYGAHQSRAAILRDEWNAEHPFDPMP